MTQNKTKPQAGPQIPEWKFDKQGYVTAVRDANFWRSLPGGAVACTLCYRACMLKRGEDGWCQYRGNRGGKMVLHDHGVLTCLQRDMLGYAGGMLTYDTGALAMSVGGSHCTAGCVFCAAAMISWRPEKLPWVPNPNRLAQGHGHYYHRGYAHPAGVVATAQAWGATHVLLWENEPMLSFEFSYDVARLAKQAGLKVIVFTNGFSTPKAVERIGPYVDAVNIGFKGSGAPAFYDTWMKSPGAVPAVWESVRAWRASGAYVLLSNILAPPQMQDNQAFMEAERQFTSTIAEVCGPHQPVLIALMEQPGPEKFGKGEMLLPRSMNPDRYLWRVVLARKLAVSAGLAYYHSNNDPVHCHACGGLLIVKRSPMRSCAPCILHTHFCPHWTHEQHVTADGCCDHCGAAVPVRVCSDAQLVDARRRVRDTSANAKYASVRLEGIADT
jgi:pyruvate formate lyase activating enzyme